MDHLNETEFITIVGEYRKWSKLAEYKFDGTIETKLQ